MERNKKLINKGIAIIAAVSALVLLGHMLILGQLEKSLRKLAVDSVEEVEFINVRIAGTTPFTLFGGRLGQVDCYAENVKPKNAPLIKSVAVTLRDVRFNANQLSSVGSAQVLAVLHQEDANKYIRTRSGLNPPFPTLDFQPGRVRASVRLPLLMNPPSISVEGEIAVENKNLLKFRASSMDLAGNKISGDVLRLLSEKINPILDLSGVRPKVEIEDFIPGSNNIRVFGRIIITEPVVFRRD